MPTSNIFIYPHYITLNMQTAKNAVFEKTVKVTDPIISLTKLINLIDIPFYLSYCVVPGLDPQTDSAKVCQDACYAISDENSLLMCLFDGHGEYGEEVVKFCVSTVESLYSRVKEKMGSNPLNFLQELSMKCDENLNKSEIDLSLSGCTALFIFFTKGNLYMASIGDSRAVLATEVVPEVLPVKEADSNNTEILDEIKEQRKLPSTLYSIQLTKDQKPEHPEECARISDCGGRVQQLLDRNGMKIGPYRVFDLKGNQPGLAMSRSLGDLLGKKVGVISTPAFTKYKFHKETDSFLVIASDGIWDVMDNQEVVNFVETFRTKCLKEIELPFIVTETITPSNVSISQLLCEEARTRWCTIVENENVMIDDISCIVLEFNQKVSAHANEIKYYAQGTSKCEQVSDVRRATSIHEIKTRDPRRGSFCVSK